MILTDCSSFLVLLRYGGNTELVLLIGDADEEQAVLEACSRVFGGPEGPMPHVITVSGIHFIKPEWRVEIEATAMLPDENV